MKVDTNVFLATEETEFVSELTSILGLRKGMALGGVCKNVSELRVYLEQTPTQLVVVDIDSNPPYILQELGKVIPLHPETRFAVASHNSNSEMILSAMRSGVREFLPKESIEAELDRVLERLLFDIAGTSKSLGSVISVFSTSGGCGATTVVVNLANELRLKSSEPVLTIDLDSCYGGVSNYLGISGHYGIADILAHNGPIDENLITSSVTKYADNFDVLLNTANGDHFAPKYIQQDNLTPVFEACRQAYRYTIVDAARVPQDMAELLAATSKAILVVFQMTVKDVKMAKAAISKLTTLGANPDMIIPLANRYRKRGLMIPLEETKKVLGLSSLHVVKSINGGELLADCASWSRIRRDFQSLVSRICTLEENGNGQSKR
jgi:pilus assembly protein CpaE